MDCRPTLYVLRPAILPGRILTHLTGITEKLETRPNTVLVWRTGEARQVVCSIHPPRAVTRVTLIEVSAD